MDAVRAFLQGSADLFIEKDVKSAKMARMPKPRSVPLCKEAEALKEHKEAMDRNGERLRVMLGDDEKDNGPESNVSMGRSQEAERSCQRG